MSEKQVRNLVLFIFICIKFVLQYVVVDPVYELHRDEYLHLDQATNPAWGYISVPPFTSWISIIIRWLGNSIFWIRFFPALFGALTMLAVWKAVEKLNGSLFACILCASGLLFSVLLRLNILYQPNSADVLFWTLCFYFLICFISSGENKFLYFTAISFAFGMLNKYNIIFWAAGMLPALLITSHKRILLNKHFWFAALLALLIFLPNLIWQIRMNFPVIGHMKELSERQLVNVRLGNFISDQLLYFMGSFFMWMAAFPAFVFYAPFKKYRIIGWSFLFIMGIFIFFHAKSYYTIGLYPIFFAFGCIYLDHLTNKKWLRIARIVLVLIPALVLIPMFNIIFPLLSPKEIMAKREKFAKFGLLRWEDGLDHDMPQDFADMRGWKEMTALVDSAYAMVPANAHANTLIFCDNYGQAGALNYYSKYKNLGAVSFNADYLTWFPWDMKIDYAVRVREFGPGDDLKNEERLFHNVSIIGRVSDSSAREFGTMVILLQHAREDVMQFLRTEEREND